MYDLLCLGIVAVFALANWGLLVLFSRIFGGRK